MEETRQEEAQELWGLAGFGTRSGRSTMASLPWASVFPSAKREIPNPFLDFSLFCEKHVQ